VIASREKSVRHSSWVYIPAPFAPAGGNTTSAAKAPYLAATYDSCVKYDGCHRRLSLHPAPPFPSLLPSTISPLHSQYTQCFSGSLFAI
jgi:hypothetical protein